MNYGIIKGEADEDCCSTYILCESRKLVGRWGRGISGRGPRKRAKVRGKSGIDRAKGRGELLTLP